MCKDIFNKYPKLKACRFCENLYVEKYQIYDSESIRYCNYDEGELYDYDYAECCSHFKPSDTTLELLEKFKQYANPFSILKYIGGKQ